MIITDHINIDSRPSASVAVIGQFDGVHLSHQHALHEAVRMARSMNAMAVAIVTPALEQSGDAPCCLTTADEKMQMLEQCGADLCLLLPSCGESTGCMTEILGPLLKERLRALHVIAAEDLETTAPAVQSALTDYCAAEGIIMQKAEPLIVDGEEVCSETIRRMLLSGDVSGASRMLGRNYTVSGTVIGGQRKGREIGFPTANISFADTHKLVPRRGVYATTAKIACQNAERLSMTNIGMRPTFEGSIMTIETHILDFSADIYGETLSVSFLRHIRDERRFCSVSELISQLQEDAREVEKEAPHAE